MAPAFDRVLAMIGAVKSEGLETCATLGMLDRGQADRLRDAGLDYYNHNLDSGRGFLRIDHHDTYLRRPPRHPACGAARRHQGLLRRHPRHGRDARGSDRSAVGSSRARSLTPRACRSTRWCRSTGTPLADQPPVPWDEVVRVIATARILMPDAKVRLSAGRMEMGGRDPGAVLPGGCELHLSW